MTIALDQHAINHMTTAISQEMNPQRGRSQPYADTLFMGGPLPSETDATQLGIFGQQKNWKIIFPSFDPADALAGPISFHAVVTDGIAQTIVLSGGLLWKENRRSPAVLLFPGHRIIVKLSAKGRLLIRPLRGQYHDHGYELARAAVCSRAAENPGTVPVVAGVGSLTTVMDIKAVSAMLAAGE